MPNSFKTVGSVCCLTGDRLESERLDLAGIEREDSVPRAFDLAADSPIQDLSDGLSSPGDPTWDNCFKTPTTWARVQLLSANPVAPAAINDDGHQHFPVDFHDS